MGRNKEGRQSTEAMESWKLSIKPICQAAQFFAGVSASSSNAFFVGVEGTQALSSVVKVKRKRGLIGKGSDPWDE